MGGECVGLIWAEEIWRLWFRREGSKIGRIELQLRFGYFSIEMKWIV